MSALSTDAHKTLIRRFNDEVWNQGNLAVVDDTFAADCVWHSPPPGLPATREGLGQMIAGFRAAFADTRATVDDQIAEDDRIAWRWTFEGTHVGPLMGIPPTGKRITFTGTSIDRIVGGKVAERWDNADMLGLMQQLGAIPAA